MITSLLRVIAAILVCASFVLAEEDSRAASRAPQIYKVCNEKNPPPCADKPPVLKHQRQADPAYTTQAQREKIEGDVILSLVVTVDGHASDIKVEKSLDYGLDKQAMKAVKKWKFQPATREGRPVPVAINVEVNFRLR